MEYGRRRKSISSPIHSLKNCCTQHEQEKTKKEKNVFRANETRCLGKVAEGKNDKKQQNRENAM